jgi:opacity protein-like surface antigen
MKKSCAVLILLAVFGIALPAEAQDETSKLEAYGGYDYVRFNISANVPGFPPSSSYNASGGGGQLEYNPNNWLGAVGDLDGYGVTKGALLAGAFSYMFGPRVNLRRAKITPFTQVLFGGIVATSGIGHPGTTNAFAMAAGGGLDFNVSKHISVRPMQAEYFMTKFADGLNNRQNNFRFSTGVVFRFGRAG